MKIATLVATGILCLAVAAIAYDGPTSAVQEAIRYYSEPDQLGFGLVLASSCGLDREAAETRLEGEFIRSRIDNIGIPSSDWALFLVISANCFERPSGGYVYTVTAEFSMFEDGVLWNIDSGYGSFGITPDTQDIVDSILEGARRALTDFIYSHDSG